MAAAGAAEHLLHWPACLPRPRLPVVVERATPPLDGDLQTEGRAAAGDCLGRRGGGACCAAAHPARIALSRCLPTPTHPTFVFFSVCSDTCSSSSMRRASDTLSCIWPRRAAMISMSSIARALSGLTRLMRATGGAGAGEGGGRGEQRWENGSRVRCLRTKTHSHHQPALTSVAGRGLHQVHQHRAPLLLRRLALLLRRRLLLGALGRAPAAALLPHQLRHAPLPDGLQLRVIRLWGGSRGGAGGRGRRSDRRRRRRWREGRRSSSRPRRVPAGWLVIAHHLCWRAGISRGTSRTTVSAHDTQSSAAWSRCTAGLSSMMQRCGRSHSSRAPELLRAPRCLPTRPSRGRML